MDILNEIQIEFIRTVMCNPTISRGTLVYKTWMDNEDLTMKDLLNRIFTLGYQAVMSEMEQNAQN